MSSKRSKKVEELEPPKSDDFEKIRGIGPNVAARLSSVGILTYGQLASLSPADAMTLLSDITGLSTELISQQDWIGQATRLANPAPENTNSDDSTDYARFSLELRLDEDNEVQHTKIQHVQSKAEYLWDGWQAEKLVEAITKSAALRFKLKHPNSAAQNQLTDLKVTENTSTGVIHLQNLELSVSEGRPVSNLLRYGENFNVYLSLDFSEIADPEQSSFDYTAQIYARSLEGLPRQLLGEARGSLNPAQQIRLKVAATTPPRGMYRLEATVVLTLPQAGPMAILEGSLLQVY